VETGWVSDPNSRWGSNFMSNWVSNLETQIPRYDVDGVIWTPAAYPGNFTSQRTANLTDLTKPVYYVVRIAGERSNRDVVRASALCAP
jgi:hypothetical protein